MTARLLICLAIAACLQLGAVALLYWPQTAPDTGARDAAVLLPLSGEEIGYISVTDAKGASATVARRDGQWVIDGTSLPADAAVVERLLGALGGPAGFPVASSDSARERFAVDDARYQRRIAFGKRSDDGSANRAADISTTIYLGTSPGMRRVHARRDDSAAIRTVTLSTFDVPATVDGWLDASLLALGGIDRVRTSGGAWNKSDSTWTVSGTSQAVDGPTGRALATLAEVLGTLQVTGVVLASDTESGADAASAELAVWRNDQATTLQLASAPEGSDARIYSSDFDRWFTLSDYDHDRLASALEELRALNTKNGAAG